MKRCAALMLLGVLFGRGVPVPGALAQSEAIHYGVSTGVDVSRGDYGLAEDSDLIYLPTTLRVSRGPWSARATLAYLAVSGPAGAVINDGVFTPISGNQRGFGDVVLGLTYATGFFWLGANYVDATVKVKLPTAAEERGLGTGAADYSFKLEAFRSHGDWTPSAAIGYRILGDGAGFKLRNAALASVGVDRRLNDTVNVGGLLDWREPASGGAHDALEFVPYLSWRIGGGFTLTGYGTVGLAKGSPDAGIGMQIGYRTGQR